MKFVIVESPYAGETERNTAYAYRCLRKCIDDGEVPFASHLLFPRVLQDFDPRQRQQGIELGYRYWDFASTIRFYLDYGWSPGMELAFERAVERGYDIEIAFIGRNGVQEKDIPYCEKLPYT